MDRFARSKLDDLAWVSACVVCALLAGCGESSCPAGSTSINGRCEPALACRAGEVEIDGACVDDESSGRGDAGLDDPGLDKDSGTQERPLDAGHRSDAADQDTGVMESSDPACASVECGDHGGCQVEQGAAICVCTDGFAGMRCEMCEAGLVAQDEACVAPCDADDAPDCSDDGECDDTSGDAVCVCEHPSAGETCSTDTSNVPPPRSKTTIFSSFFLSRP